MSTEAMAKVRGIGFISPMALALRDGKKTQTRRVMNPQPWYGLCVPGGPYFRWPPGHNSERYNAEGSSAGNFYRLTAAAESYLATHCDIGSVGDGLRVRESFYVDHVDYLKGPLPPTRPPEIGDNLYYRADGTCCQQIPECSCAEVGKPRWRSSRFMPGWASRTTLEITRVRVQPVQEITEDDAKAEGLYTWTKDERLYKWSPGKVDGGGGEFRSGTWPWTDMPHSARDAYARLWDELNAKPKPVYVWHAGQKIIDHYVSYPWGGRTETRVHRGRPWNIISNPWVWAIDFTPTHESG